MEETGTAETSTDPGCVKLSVLYLFLPVVVCFVFISPLLLADILIIPYTFMHLVRCISPRLLHPPLVHRPPLSPSPSRFSFSSSSLLGHLPTRVSVCRLASHSLIPFLVFPGCFLATGVGDNPVSLSRAAGWTPLPPTFSILVTSPSRHPTRLPTAELFSATYLHYFSSSHDYVVVLYIYTAPLWIWMFKIQTPTSPIITPSTPTMVYFDQPLRDSPLHLVRSFHG